MWPLAIHRTLLRIAALAALALLVWACAPRPDGNRAADADEPTWIALDLASWRGIWASDGYGYWLEVSAEGVPRVFSAAGAYCIEEAADESLLSMLDRERRGSAGERYLSSALDPYEYRFDRKEQLPTACLAPASATPLAVFDAVAALYAEHYAFFELYGVDWTSAVARARRSLSSDADDAALYATLVDLLQPLKDSHIKLEAEVDGSERVHDGEIGEVERRVLRHADALSPREAVHRYRRQYWFDGIRDDLLQGKGTLAGNQRIQYGMVDPAVGYLAIASMGGYAENEDASYADDVPVLDAILDAALLQFEQSGAVAVIVDLSLNTGGYDFIGLHIAGRFAERPALAYTRRAHDARLTPAFDIEVVPSIHRRFTGPVYLLTSGDTVSAAEIMVLAMRALPNVTHAGETTRGAFSTVLPKTLPNGWQLSLSNEIYVDPQGINWEGRGMPPELQLAVYGESPPQGHTQAVRALVEQARTTHLR